MAATNAPNENINILCNKIDFKHGDIVIHDGGVAIKLDFKIDFNLSLLLDQKVN